jgi:hypothetical protein
MMATELFAVSGLFFLTPLAERKNSDRQVYAGEDAALTEVSRYQPLVVNCSHSSLSICRGGQPNASLIRVMFDFGNDDGVCRGPDSGARKCLC